MRSPRAGNSSASRLLWVAITVVSVLFIVTVSYAFYGEHGAVSDASKSSPDTDVVASAREAIAEIDTDGDGLPDWEEILWATDPKNPDSNNDGVPDSRTTPGIAWQDSPNGTSSLDVDGYATETSNSTVVAARELFGGYFLEMSKSNNASLTPEEQAVLVEQALRSTQESFVPPTLSRDELTIVPSTQTTRRTYVTTMTTIFNELYYGAERDYELMRDLSTDARAEATVGLERSLTQYEKSISRLKGIAVPDDTAFNHRAMVSSLMGYAFLIEAIKNMEHDPVRAAAAVQLVVQYDEAIAFTVDEFWKYAEPYEQVAL